MLLMGATQIWSSDSDSVGKNRKVSAAFQVSDVFTCMLLSSFAEDVPRRYDYGSHF